MFFDKDNRPETPVQILLFDLWILFSSDLQAVTRTDQMLGSNVATDTITNRTQMIKIIIRLLTYIVCVIAHNQ